MSRSVSSVRSKVILSLCSQTLTLLPITAIIPLAKLLGFGTEEIALRVGQALGGREWTVFEVFLVSTLTQLGKSSTERYTR